jgi:lipocalin
MKLLLVVGCLVLFKQSTNVLGCTPPAFSNLTVQSNFSLNKFLGIWYEIKWLPATPHNISDIWRSLYQSFQLVNASTQHLLVNGTARLYNKETCFSFGPWSIIANNSAKMILERQDLSVSEPLNWPYYIVKTDYDNYMLVYGCISDNYTQTEPCWEPILWLFSRTPTLSNDYVTTLDQYIVDTLCINLTALEITPQTDTSC